MKRSSGLEPLATLAENTRGAMLPLPARLARLYGRLHMPTHRARPHVYSNFAITLDGIVSLGVPGHSAGGDISGFNLQDRMVMGLLRAAADVVIVGSGTLAADRRAVWTADGICPELSTEYRSLRARLGLGAAPLNVVVSGSGNLDLKLPVFASGRVRALIVTTETGARRLRRQKVPGCVRIQAIQSQRGAIPASKILRAARPPGAGGRVLVEGGPQLLGELCAARLIDELFLTLAPQIAGRRIRDRRLSLVMGEIFAPAHPLWGRLVDVRRGRDHLFLRYAFPVRSAA